MPSTAAEPAVEPPATVELTVDGMTCSSCAARIEKRLNRLDGVRASVNYATERATIRYDPIQVAASDLVDTVRAAGYQAYLPDPAVPGQAGPDGDSTYAEAAGLRRRLLACVPLALPVLVLAMVPSFQFDGWQWLSLALATPVVLWGGWPFHAAAAANLRHRATTMDTLVSLGVLAAYGWSLYALVFGTAGDIGMRMRFDLGASSGSGSGDIYLEIASVVVVFLLTGRFLEARAKRRSGAALRTLLELGARDAVVLRDGVQTRVPVGELAVGDTIVVRPGEKIASDGIVLDGVSAVDASLLTGESVPVDVGPQHAVAGGSINGAGRLLVQATRVGADTTLAQIGRLVTAAQSGKAPVQRLADRISAVFVPIVVLLAAVTLLASLAAGQGSARAFTAAVAVLIVACPCALGLATPTALLVGTGRGAQLGLLIKGPEVLESTQRVDTVVLDKTGTVTTGRMTLHAVHAAPGTDPGEVLHLAGALEHGSEHPIAVAIADAATQQYGPLPEVAAFTSAAGLGVRGTVIGHAVQVGRRAMLAEAGLQPAMKLETAARQAESSGRTAVFAAWDGAIQGLLVVGDEVKAGSREAVQELRALGLRPVLLTGDNLGAALAVATEVGIGPDAVTAEVLPDGKVAAIRALQEHGATVAMVGDGVNDAAALAQADLGLAMGSGSDVAIEASDLTLMRGDLHAAADAIRLARRTLRTIQGNLFWAFAYNVVLIPVAALGLLSPLLAGAAMAFSSVFVVTNSLRLRRFGRNRATDVDIGQ
jgi:Cu+-exporting ATPase